MNQDPIRGRFTAGLILLVVLPISTHGKPARSRPSVAAPGRAKAIIEASGVEGGLVVVIGCDDPALLADIRGAGPYLVHGLDADQGKVSAARERLRQRGLYGPVTVSRLRGAQLPYVESLVNLVVVTGQTRSRSRRC